MVILVRIISKNKKVYFNYELLAKFEAGIILTGSEIKSIRLGEVSLQESHITFIKNEIFIINMNISSYKFSSSFLVSPTRSRKLLLNKNEIKKLQKELKLKGLTIIPTKIYINNHGFAKLEIALGRGKKLHDKRETIKLRTVRRQIKA